MVVCQNFLWQWLLKHLKFVSLTEIKVQNSQKEKKTTPPPPQKKKKNPEDCVISGFGEGILAAKYENHQWKICHKFKRQGEDTNIAKR